MRNRLLLSGSSILRERASERTLLHQTSRPKSKSASPSLWPVAQSPGHDRQLQNAHANGRLSHCGSYPLRLELEAWFWSSQSYPCIPNHEVLVLSGQSYPSFVSRNMNVLRYLVQPESIPRNHGSSSQSASQSSAYSEHSFRTPAWAATTYPLLPTTSTQAEPGRVCKAT